MTWSIVARDPRTGAYGVAVSTCAFAVGARVPHGGGRVGALATQAMINPLYGVDGLRLLQEGRTAGEIVTALTRADPGREHRQLHVVDAAGRVAAWTGTACIDWCGHVAGDGVSVAGNMLAGPRVIETTLETWQAHPDLDFDERLVRALAAGEAAGGDKRGRQSAALRIWESEPYALIDIRVDDHADPLGELRRLLAVAHERYLPYARACPTRNDPGGVTDRAELERRIEAYRTARAGTRGRQQA